MTSRSARKAQIQALENRAADHFDAAESYDLAGPGWENDAARHRTQGADAANRAAEAQSASSQRG